MLRTILIFIISSLIFISCSENFAENEQALINKLSSEGDVALEDAQCLVKEMKEIMPSEDYNKFVDLLLVVDEPGYGEDMTMDEQMEFMGFLMIQTAFLKKAGETCSVEMDM